MTRAIISEKAAADCIHLSGSCAPIETKCPTSAIWQESPAHWTACCSRQVSIGMTIADLLEILISETLSPETLSLLIRVSMSSIPLKNFDQVLPEVMPVSVVMQKRPAQNRWVDFTYQAISVLPGDEHADSQCGMIYQQHDGVEHHLFSGLKCQLHVDECESYYHNLMSPEPGCFVVAGEVDDINEMPVPYLVSLSFDEVHAYLEGDEAVYAVEIPAKLYQWAEAYILTHYVVTKKFKRKLKHDPRQHDPRQPRGSAS